MNSLLKSVHSLSHQTKKNVLIREGLQRQLSTSVIEMQSAQNVLDGVTVGNCDESMSLCCTLEAVFLHGLKDSLLNRVTEAISGPDFDAMPQPSFWGPLLVFSHREIIDQITAFSQITTEVGYCRAWIRLALNEGLLASYFSSIMRDNSALNPYYSRAAFIRDVDLVEVAQRHIESLDYVKFDLACNTSLLNFWNSTPLMMAAVWSPPMKSCPVNSAVDIAKTINSDVEIVEEGSIVSSPIGSYGSFNSSNSFSRFGGANEDDALNIILGNPVRTRTEIMNEMEGEKNDIEEDEVREKILEQVKTEPDVKEKEEKLTEQKDEITTEEEAENSAMGNSLIGRLGWSSSLEEHKDEGAQANNVEVSQTPITPSEGLTYDCLIEKYQSSVKVSDENEISSSQSESVSDKTEKEIPVESTVGGMKTFLGIISCEQGLDTQNYSCKSCGHLIGLTFATAHVCKYSGQYYCSSCMMIEDMAIPARIVYNWDFNRYPVSLKAANYLNNCQDLVDLKELNPQIYHAVDCMAQLEALRVQLNLLGAYLFSCREPIIEALQKKVSPRDYLYETVHKYSFQDLLDAPSGSLAQQLQKLIEFARDHVLNCWLCSQKGFICEICNNPKVIYPFNMKSTYRCSRCKAVFHADCLNASKPCPKCERRRKRMDLPLMDLDQSNVVPENNATTSPICIK